MKLFIIKDTNQHGKQYLQSNELMPSSRVPNWKETNNKEMKCFLALLRLQEVTNKPKEKWFWSLHSTISTPFFGKG